MRVVRVVEVAGRSVEVHELTVGEIRAWLRDMRTDGDGVDWALLEECSLHDILKMSDLTADAINGLTQSELRQVLDAAKEVNADFFGLRGRLEAMAQQLRATSSAPSAASSPSAILKPGITHGPSFWRRCMGLLGARESST